MNNRELYSLSKANLDKIKYIVEYESGKDKPYLAKNLLRLREGLEAIESVPFLEDIFKALKNTKLYANDKDAMFFDHVENRSISKNMIFLEEGLRFFIRQFESTHHICDENSLVVKLPPLKTFSDLSKIANDFKKALEIPLLDSKCDSDLDIKTVEPGSIWLFVSVGTVMAVQLIGAIAWSSAVVKKKRAEAKMFMEHARTLELKNNGIDLFIQAQKIQLENILNDEAEAIVSKHYSNKDPETIERLKLSINTVSDLIEKGSEISPGSNSDDVKQLFPDYKNLSLIESAIKKIS